MIANTPGAYRAPSPWKIHTFGGSEAKSNGKLGTGNKSPKNADDRLSGSYGDRRDVATCPLDRPSAKSFR